jgi:glycosyltransferase involved in cell wall biosynthesis
LADTLGSLASARSPNVPWEVVVVDNGSTDHTAMVLETFRARLPLRLFYEPQSGLSHARARAVASASGEWLAWIDDDVLVPIDWLLALRAATLRYADMAFLGGATRQRFDGTPPAWLQWILPGVANFFGIQDLGTEDRPLGRHEAPFGANMVIRRDWLDRVAFDPALGYAPGRLMGGEETALLASIREAGGQGQWIGSLGLDHVIQRDRYRGAWLISRLKGAGDEMVAMGLRRGRGSLLGVPWWLWLEMLQLIVLLPIPWGGRTPWIRRVARLIVVSRAVTRSLQLRPV